MNFVLAVLMVIFLSIVNIIFGARFHREINGYLDINDFTEECRSQSVDKQQTPKAQKDKVVKSLEIDD